MLARYLKKYNDTLLFLVLIPFINTINYHLTYTKIQWDWYTITTYLIDTAQGYIAWWIVRSTILWLDKKLPYDKAFVKRIFIQIILTNILAQTFIILATVLINDFFGDGPLPVKFYTYNLFIFFIWILVINGIYVGMYFYDQWHTSTYLREQDKKLRSVGFEVQLGKTLKTIPFEEIAAFFVDSGFSYLKTKEGRDYIIDSSLNQIIPRLPEELFFRLNRKFIVARDLIKGYTKTGNGKLKALILENTNLPAILMVSRITAPKFKRWYSATSE